MSAGHFSVYVHLPFCKSRCAYCDFFSTVYETIPFRTYRRALISEWRRRRAAFRHLHRIESVYLGGGTPSLWPKEELGALLEAFSLQGDEEVTAEVNPGDADETWFRDLVRCGVKRFSIGVQALDDERLAFMGRRHTVRDAVRCVEAALDSEAGSVSADLIFGTYRHSRAGWRQELKSLIDLGVHHISAYELTVVEGTPLQARQAGGDPVTCSESALLDLYRTGRAMLRKAGFEQYEVSNFAKAGHRSLHNASYWSGSEYLGLGAGAHGFLKSDGRLIRYGNTENVDNYLLSAFDNDAPLTSGLGKGALTEQLSAVDHGRELVMLGLRTTFGFAFDEIVSTLPIDIGEKWKLIASSLQREKLVRFSFGRMIPTARGMLFADGIAQSFF